MTRNPRSAFASPQALASAFYKGTDRIVENSLPDRAQHDLAAGYLQHAAGQAVYDYFEKRANEPSGNDLFSKIDSDGLFSQLLRRRDPLIDLALARFTSHEKTLCELWERGDRDLCLAIAANRQRKDLLGLTRRAISDIAEGYDDLLRCLVFRSSTISLDTLRTVFDRQDAFACLSDVAWLNVVEAAVFAPCLRARIEGNARDDLTLDAILKREKRKRAFEAAWALLLKIPPRPNYATLLALLYIDIADVNLSEQSFLTEAERADLARDLDELGACADAPNGDHPKNAEEDEDEIYWSRHSELVDHGRQRFLDAVFSRWQSTDLDSSEATKRQYAWLREVIARRVFGKVDERFLRDHPDAAVRVGFYEGCESLSVDEAKAAVERDGERFLEVLATHLWAHRRTEYADLLTNMACQWTGWSEDGRTAWERRYRERGIALWQQDPELFAHPDRDHSLPFINEAAAQKNDATNRDEVIRKLGSLERKTVWIGRTLIFGASASLFYIGTGAMEHGWNASPVIANFLSFIAAVGLAAWLGHKFDKL